MSTGYFSFSFDSENALRCLRASAPAYGACLVSHHHGSLVTSVATMNPLTPGTAELLVWGAEEKQTQGNEAKGSRDMNKVEERPDCIPKRQPWRANIDVREQRYRV